LLVPAWSKSKRATRTILQCYERQAHWLVDLVNFYRDKLGMPRWIVVKEREYGGRKDGAGGESESAGA